MSGAGARNGGSQPFAWFGEAGSGAFITKGENWYKVEDTAKGIKDVGIMAFLIILLLAASKRK